MKTLYIDKKLNTTRKITHPKPKPIKVDGHLIGWLVKGRTFPYRTGKGGAINYARTLAA